MSENTTFFKHFKLIKLALACYALIIIDSTGFSQKLTDSLFHELDLMAQVDTTKFNSLKSDWEKQCNFSEFDQCALTELEGNKYHYTGDDFTAKKIYLIANKCAKEQNNNAIELSTRIKMNWLDLERGLIDEEEAIETAEKALDEASFRNDTIRMVMAYNALALFNLNLGKKDIAVEYYYHALKISQNSKYFLHRATILINLGLYKSELGNTEGAVKDLKEGLKLVENKRQYRMQARILNNLALTYSGDSINKDSSFYYYNKTLELSKLISEPQLLLAAYANMGVYYNIYGDYSKSRLYYDSAIHIVEKYEIIGKQGRIYLGLADFYRRQSKYELALKMMEKGSEKVKTENYPKLEDMMYYEKLYADIYEALGKNSKALLHNKRYHHYRDSLEDMNHAKFLAELDLKYEDEKRLVEIEKQKSRADLAEKRQEVIRTESSLNIMRNTAIFIGIILVIGIVFSIYVIRSINGKKVMEQKYASNLISDIEHERKRISSDLHDHIGLNLILIKNELNEKPDNQKFVTDVSKIVEDVRKISRNIYPSQLNKLGVKKSIEAMFDKIETSTGILTSYELEDLEQITFSKGEELILYRIIQELSNNSIKHSQSKSIRLIATVKPKKLILEYRDNGIGFDKSKILETSSGMGLRNIINRVEKIRGSIHFDTKKNQGIKVTISFERKV